MAPDISGGKERRTDLRNLQRHQECRAPTNYRKESERLKTLKNWPASFLDSKKVAKNGFYYSGTDDVVTCAFCNVQIGLWKHGDDPEVDHRRDSPDCPLLNGQECGNRGLSETGDESEGSNDEETIAQDVCGTCRLEIRPFSGPERPCKSPLAIEATNLWRNFEELGVSKLCRLVAPQYATYSARIKTFENWPVPEIQSPEGLAEAGFYYTLYNDNVLCFHCGGGLKNWEVDDDPWVEHARWFSRCDYVILRKGKGFITEVLAKEKRLAESLTEKKSEEVSEGEKVAEVEKEVPTSSTEISSDPLPTAPKSNCSEEIQQNPEGKEIALCRICYVTERRIVFLPCGHFVSCTDCAPSLTTCVVCRKPIEAIVRAYLS